jgi:hypothetical protein
MVVLVVSRLNLSRVGGEEQVHLLFCGGCCFPEEESGEAKVLLESTAPIAMASAWSEHKRISLSHSLTQLWGSCSPLVLHRKDLAWPLEPGGGDWGGRR